jgi:hypothetical protein
MSLMLACREFFSTKGRGGISSGNRGTTQELFEARCGKDKYKTDIFVPGVPQADPRLRGNEDNRSRMNIAFFTSEPHMSRTGLDQDDFVLSEVFVPCDLPAGRNGLRSQNQMAGPTVFWVHFDRELSRRNGRLARPSDAVFAIVLLENEGLCCHVGCDLRRCLNLRNRVASKKHHTGAQYEKTPSHSLLSPFSTLLVFGSGVCDDAMNTPRAPITSRKNNHLAAMRSSVAWILHRVAGNTLVDVAPWSDPIAM